MSSFVLDTDTLSLLQRSHAVVAANVARRNLADLAITAISVEEHLSGWYRLFRQAKDPVALSRAYDQLIATFRHLSQLRILSFTVAAIQPAKTLQGLKLNVRKMDLCIAAIALEHQAIVVTRNVRDFQRIPHLSVEDWSV